MQIIDPILALLHESDRHRQREEETFREKDKRHRVVYYGSTEELAFWQSTCDRLDGDPDVYETALRLALQQFRQINPEGYALIDDYYFHGRISFTELGRMHGISRQAATKALKRNVDALRPLVEAYIGVLECW